MATINNIYVFVESESLNRSTKIPQHAVEKGLPITDNVREEAKTISLTGKIVDTTTLSAADILTKIEALRTSGSLIKYSGRNVAGNFLIRSFNTTHPNTIYGGASFSMELVEVRIAQSSYTPQKENQSSNTSTDTAKAPVIEVGATVIFKGGNVYVSSDATTPAANRGRQTCKVTKISRKSWSIHQIHLVSTEKKYPNNVYGWVDEGNIEGSSATVPKTGATTNGGTQQTNSPKTTTTTTAKNTLIAKYYRAKSGDTYTNVCRKLKKYTLYDVDGKKINFDSNYLYDKNPKKIYAKEVEREYNDKTVYVTEYFCKANAVLLVGYNYEEGIWLC